MTAKKRVRLSAEQRKTAFLDAAAEIIQGRGLQALTMERLAAHVGVNKALPYRHFANSDDVLVALYERSNVDFDSRLAENMEKARGFRPKLKVLLDTWYRDVADGRALPEILQARTETGVLEARREVRNQMSIEYVADLIQEFHKIRRADAKLASSVLLAGSQGLSGIWGQSEKQDAALINSFLDMAVGAVRAIARQSKTS